MFVAGACVLPLSGWTIPLSERRQSRNSVAREPVVQPLVGSLWGVAIARLLPVAQLLRVAHGVQDAPNVLRGQDETAEWLYCAAYSAEGGMFVMTSIQHAVRVHGDEMPLAPLLAAAIAQHGQAGARYQLRIHLVHIAYLDVEQQPGDGPLTGGRHTGVARVDSRTRDAPFRLEVSASPVRLRYEGQKGLRDLVDAFNVVVALPDAPARTRAWSAGHGRAATYPGVAATAGR